MSETSSEPRFPKPKILLVDLPEGATKRLSSAGFNVRSGTFGRPYKVPKSDNFAPVIVKHQLPNRTEQEVVIIDLRPPKPTDEPEGTKHVSDGELDMFAKASGGWIDPRPRAMLGVSDDWNRILASGGVFVVFAQPRHDQQFVSAIASHGTLDRQKPIAIDNWSFLDLMSRANFTIKADHGTETQVPPSIDFLEAFLRKHQIDLVFDTVLTPTHQRTDENYGVEFIPLVYSKFKECISVLLFAKKPNKGRILILPQFKDKELSVYELVATVLPEISPHLFPSFEGHRWVHTHDYEHASVLRMKAVQRSIMEEAEARVIALEAEINSEQERLAFQHGILTGTGDQLVADVKAVFTLIGFRQVLEPEEESGSKKQEDLQIHDRSPTLLIEVKGIAGQPTEGDTLQVTKYILRRVKEWNRTNVSGVFLVNHQRILPALERDHENVFTDQQLADAVENGMGLITTWDLFRLVRGMLEWNWPVSTVQDVFFGKGRLSKLPSHYELAGRVAHFYGEISVLSIDVLASGLRVGETMGFLFPAGFAEETITSLQVDKVAVNEAQPGQRAGSKTSLKRKDVPEGTPVYVVRKQEA